jgi:hypothetical protein
LIEPLARTLKRLAALFFVFILGMKMLHRAPLPGDRLPKPDDLANRAYGTRAALIPLFLKRETKDYTTILIFSS